ncbi:MAG: biopolymer transporter ExbD [Alphaproteobacteria bacterium]|nr:biopolymer transporter ExbD [Alphaproteobacteria bacterium]
MIRRPASDDETSDLWELSPNLTPLLDVLFMLLFFLVLSANTAQYALELSLPVTQTPATALPSQTTIVITLPRAGEAVIVDDVVLVGWDRTRAFLLQRIQARPDATFLIAGDRDARLQSVVRVLSILREGGVPGASILVQQE